jgi:hypothetical protein
LEIVTRTSVFVFSTVIMTSVQPPALAASPASPSVAKIQPPQENAGSAGFWRFCGNLICVHLQGGQISALRLRRTNNWDFLTPRWNLLPST